MVESVDGLLDQLLGQYQVLAYFIVVSNVIHAHLNHFLLHYYLWTPQHHCKLPGDWEETEALPVLSELLAENSTRAVHDPNIVHVDPAYDPNRPSRSGTLYLNKFVGAQNGDLPVSKSETRTDTDSDDPSAHKSFLLQNQTILVRHNFKSRAEIDSPNNNRSNGEEIIRSQVSIPSSDTGRGQESITRVQNTSSFFLKHEDQFSSCEMYVDPSYPSSGTQPCVHGYVFSLRKTEWTITTEWGLVCDRAWITRWLTVSYSVGQIVGGIGFGILSDRFGRRILMLICVGVVGGLGLALHFVSKLVVYIVLRCAQAVFIQGLQVISWTLIAELLPPKWRCRGLVAAGGAAPIGSIFAAAAAMHLGHWRAIQLASSLPVIASLCYSCLVPESLRWLLVRGKVLRAHHEVNRSARLNLFLLPAVAFSHLKSLSDHLTQDETSLEYRDKPSFNPAALIRTPRVRKHVLIIGYLWFAVTVTEKLLKGEVVPFGTDGTVVRRRGKSPLFLRMENPLMESMIVSGVDGGGIIVAVMLSSLLYRRSLLIMLLLMAAGLTLAFVATLTVGSEMWGSIPVIWIILKLIGVLVVAGSRSLAGVILPEISPTSSRATAVGFCMAASALGQIATPLMVLLGSMSYDLIPWICCTALCLLAALLLFMLPETAGVNLPDVVEEAAVVGIPHRGNLVKSSKDPGYGRAGREIDFDGLVMRHSEQQYRDARINALRDNVHGPQSLRHDRYYRRGISRVRRHSCSATLRKMGASSLQVNDRNERPFSPGMSTTTSCSMCSSSSSFVDTRPDSCSTCIKNSLSPKDTSSDFVQSCSNISGGDLISTSHLSEEHDLASNGDEHKEREFRGEMVLPSNSVSSRCESISEINECVSDIAEELHNNFNTVIKAKSESKMSKINNNCSSTDSKETGSSYDHNSTFTNNNNIQHTGKVDNNINSESTHPNPKVVSSIPKPKLSTVKNIVMERREKEIAMCALQLRHARRPISPADTRRLKTSQQKVKDTGKNRNFNKFQAISNKSKLLQLTESRKSRKATQSQRTPNSGRRMSKQNHKSNLGRQKSSVESLSSDARYQEIRPKTQSFILHRKSNIGKEIALKIAKFENGETNQPLQSKIPVPSTSFPRSQIFSSLDASPCSRDTEGLSKQSSISDKVLLFEAYRLQSSTKAETVVKNDEPKIIQGFDPSQKDAVVNQSPSNEFVVPRSDVELTDDDETRL